ncbi:MAG: hypothetical protein LQ338_006529 [Usnochroma carphineum]|nr:MAG: hypothetical protein LQ338_006529 [Usnochroma carphineum]
MEKEGDQYPAVSTQTPEETSEPAISVSWSLDPPTHSYSSDTAPTLKLSLTSHATRPITIYNEYMNPSIVLAEGHLSIFDHTANVEVDQVKTRYCDFPPPSKVHVPLREQMFHTLYPEVPKVFTGTFGRGKMPPKPKLPESSNGERDKKQARGVDGLEPGHQYSLRPGKGWGYIRWWEYGEKDQVINPPEGRLDGRQVAYNRKKTPHPAIRVNVEELPEIEFWCVE